MRPLHEREPMDVGLDRNRRNRGLSIPMPVWLEERLGLVIIASAAVLIGLPLGLLGSGAHTLSPSESAYIQVVYGPAKSWKAGSPTHLEAITIKIKNTGAATAEGVMAFAAIRGQQIALNGPPSIEPGKTEMYTGGAEMNVVSTDTVTVNIVCANCPLTPSGADPNEYVSPWERERRALSGQGH